MVQLGKAYRDALGVVGVATSRTEYLGGSPSIRLEWMDGGEMHSQSFEEARLTEVPTTKVGF